MATTNVEKAAGGIVEHTTSNGVEVALIHRTRHGSEWCLPKGKLSDNETWKEAALREVDEETGFDCVITGYAGHISYFADKTPKIVLFWKMAIKGDSIFRSNDEVDKLDWLTPIDAVDRLQHPEEIQLLSTLYGLNDYSDQSGLLNRIERAWRILFHSRRKKKRLESDIAVYRQELQRGSRSRLDSDEPEACLPVFEAFNLLSLAGKAIKAGDIDKGWKCFHGAQRLELFFLQTDELRGKTLALQNEANNKLRSWRKAAIDELLGPKANPKEEQNRASIYEATLIRDEHYSNEAYKASLIGAYYLTLIVFLTMIMVSIFVLHNLDVIRFDNNVDLYSWQMISSVVSFGLLGGVVSAIIKYPDLNKTSKIPEVATTIRVMLLRVFVGSAFALVVYLILNSQLIEIFSFQIIGLVEKIQPSTIYAISFVAGFTERLVLRAVAVVAGKAG